MRMNGAAIKNILHRACELHNSITLNNTWKHIRNLQSSSAGWAQTHRGCGARMLPRSCAGRPGHHPLAACTAAARGMEHEREKYRRNMLNRPDDWHVH